MESPGGSLAFLFTLNLLLLPTWLALSLSVSQLWHLCLSCLMQVRSRPARRYTLLLAHGLQPGLVLITPILHGPPATTLLHAIQ